MNKIFFWLEWPAPYRLLYTICFLILLAVLAYTGYAFWMGEELLMPWTLDSSLESVQVPLDRFSKHFFEFPIVGDAYVLVQQFLPPGYQLNITAHHIHFGLTLFALLLILTAISDLSLTYYGIGLAFVVLFLANMKLEVLGLGADIDERWMLMLVFLAYAPLSYLFRSYWERASYLLRFGIYALLTLGLLAYGAQQEALKFPVMALQAHSMIFPLLAVGIFCSLVGHEMVRGLLFIVTNGAAPPHTRMRRLFFLSAIYLANLVYAVAHLNYGYQLDLYYLHPTVLLLLSTVLGIWGLRERAEQMHEIMTFAPTGAFLYIGLAILANSSLAFAWANGNEALNEVHQDIILHIHIGLAISVLAYIFFNFRPIILDGKKVHRIFYKPMNFDFLYAWIFGVALTVGLQFGNNFFIYDQGMAAYYTGIADAALAEGEQYIAKQHYNIARVYDPINLRVHYALGYLAKEAEERDAAYFFFEEGQKLQGSPYAYAQMARLRKGQGFSFEALHDLQEGVKKFPQNGELLNNLALELNKTALADSAYLYFMLAKDHARRPEVVESNLFSLWTKYDFFGESDSLYLQGQAIPYIGTHSNELAFYTKIGKNLDAPLRAEYLQDSVLLTPNLCYLYNYALHKAHTADTSALPYLRRFASVLENEPFDLYLCFALGHALYQQGRYREAFHFLREAGKEAGIANSYFPNLLGLRYLEHEQYATAAYHFEKAYERGHEQALMHLAIAASELPDKSRAVEAWGQLRKSPSAPLRAVASDMLRLLVPDSVAKPEQEPFADDVQRYRFLHYQERRLDGGTFRQVWAGLRQPQLQAMALAERMEHLLERQDTAAAGQVLAQLLQLDLPEEAQGFGQQAYLRWTHAQGKLDADFLEKARDAQYPRHRIGLRSFYQASALAAQGKHDEALALYRQAIEEMPYHAPVYLELSALQQRMGLEREAYATLLSSVQANPEHVGLQQAYILLCLDIGLLEYAEYACRVLADWAAPAEYQAFERVYLAKKAAVEKLVEDWE
jgi:tetratricopeptide (TPR) repeat protein